MNPTEAKFRSDLDEVAAQLDLGVRQGKYTWKEVQENLQQRALRAAGTTDTYVHENPWQIMAASAIAGVLLGWLLTKR